MEDNKDKLESDIMYKNSTTRSDRDVYRICPSKLTKRELEDLYFTLLEENMEQKKTINRQQDRIKMLTTKVQRMFSAQKVHQADERKECCVITKCVVDQHKQSMLELKRTNERMAERIRQLNAQLTSARQISKNRLFCMPKCPRMSLAASPCLTDDMSNRSVETQADLTSISLVCDENKCRTLMDELKQKIVNLEEELARAHLEYSNRMSRLEIEVSQCRNQDVLVHHESVLIEPGLQQPVASVRADKELAALKDQLQIEKNKVALLETQLKTAVISNLVPMTNENQLPSIQEQHPEENKEWESFLWDCTCTPVCPHSKQPVCTKLRLFNRGLFSSAKNTNSEEIEIPNRMNDSTPRDANVRQDLDVDNKHTDEPLVNKYKVLPEVEHKDLSGYSKREFLHKDNEYKDKPEVEYNLPSDSRHTNAFTSKEYKKKLNIESKETSEDNNHLHEFHSNKDKNNPSVKKENLPNKNKNENPHSGNEYKTLPGIEYKDLPDEKRYLNMLNVQNYEDMAKVKREEKPDVDIGQVLVSSMTAQDQPPRTQPKSLLYTDNTPGQTTSKKVPQDSNTRKVKNVPEINDNRIQSQPYTKTGSDLKDYNKSLNLGKDQNITEGYIKNYLAPQANTHALKGPGRSQSTDDKSQLIDGTSKLTDNVSQRGNDKSQRIDERNECIDIKSRRTDDTKQPIDKESQDQRTDDTSLRTDDKSEISKTSQTCLDGGDRDLHKIYENPKIADTNKQRVQTNNNVTANMPVTKSSQPQSERNYNINCYHKCGCCNATKVRDTFNSKANNNFVETMTTDDNHILNLPNNDTSQGLTNTNETLNVPTYNNRPDLTCTNEVQNQTQPYIKKDRDQTQPGANIIPNLIDTNESRGQTEADMTHNIPTLNSQNQTDFNKDKAQTQSTTKKSANPSDTNERQDVFEEGMTRNIRARQNLPYAKEVKNQTKSNIGKYKNLSQPDAIISSNLPDINESQGLSEVDMTPNKPTYQSCSNIKRNRAQTKLVTKSPNLTDTKVEQGPTETDTTRNIRTHSKNFDLPPPNEVQNQTNSNMKKIKAQSQRGTNKSPNLTDTHQTQAQTDMIRNDKHLDLPSANGVQQRIDSNPPNYIHQSVPDKNKSPDKLDTNMCQNLPKLKTSNKNQNNNNHNISNDLLQSQTVIYMEKDIAEVESDISQDLSKADKILANNARLDQERIDSNMKKNSDTQPKDNKKIGEVVTYSKDPSTLAENLTDICEEQLETIAELERQLDATEEPPRYSDNINLNFGKYFNTDEDDINEMPFSKESVSSKHALTMTKVADQNKTEDDLTRKLLQDNTRESKHKQESTTKPSTYGTKTVTPKNDRHNSLQIPGPIPSTPVQTNNWKTNVLKRFSKGGKKRISKENNKKTKEASSNTGNKVDKKKELSGTSTENESTDFYVPERDSTVIKPSQTTKKETKFVPKKTGSRHDGLSSPIKAMASNKNNLDPGALMVKCMELTMTQMIESVEKDVQVEPKTELIATQKPDTNGDVPVPTQRELKTYRSKDGTLCFETKPVLDRSRCCQCNRLLYCEDYNIKGTQPEDKTQLTSSLKQGTSTAAHSEGTQCMPLQQVGYLIPASKKMPADTPQTPLGSLASPPKNQDTNTKTASTSTNVPVTKTTKALEVLPASATTSIKIPAASSENKTTETKSVFTSTSVPANTTVVKKVQALPTDAVPKSNNNDISKEAIMCTTTTTTKAQSMQLMQERLEALAAELTRYKKMLLGPQALSVTKDQDDCSLKEHTKSVQSELDDEERQFKLKRGVAMHTIGDTYAPRCVFILHVGTVVLSDEAIKSTRDRSLILTWKFYNHNASITRMNAGRVMLFDFSSEYDIQITDEFLEYMKHEEMIIAIRDLNDHNEPFATCGLPLREALLHTNRRADMSLELVAGPFMIHARSVHHTEDDLDTGDEVGVIDLWCMLRADAKMLPIINKAIARPSKLNPRNKALTPRVMQPLIDSDNDSEKCVMNEVETTHSIGKSEQSFQAMRDLHSKNLHRWGSSVLSLPSRVYNATSYDKNIESQDREDFYKNQMRASVPKAQNSSVSAKPYTRKKSKSNSRPEKKPEQQQPKTSVDLATQASYSSLAPQYDANQYQRRLTEEKEIVMDQGHGGIFINEVIANIKTPADMKIAMENTNRNSLHHVSRLPKKDDIVSQAQSGGTSFNFIRSWLRKRNSDKIDSKTKANASSSKTHRDIQQALVLPRLLSDGVSIYKKYDNISKLYSSKTDIKKQVTINANNTNDDNMQDEPQRDEAKDNSSKEEEQTVDITILWLALNEECEAMCDPRIQKVYVAYSFLGKSGAELETPLSLPKPKHHVDKCYFNFKKTFQVEEKDITLLGHMARCRAASRLVTYFKDCIVFSVISEPPEDPLGLDTCEDIGYAFLYLGDLLAYSAGSSGYTEVIPVRSRRGSSVCGVLAVRLDGLDVLRRCAELTANKNMPSIE